MNAALAIAGGVVALVWAADRFVVGAAALARNLGVAPLVIGLTIVGFGTSAPELLVSTLAAATGHPGLAIGNAIGSNVTNVALILGVSALVCPLEVHSKIVRREIPLLLATMTFALVLLLDGRLSRLEGLGLLGGLVVMVVLVFREGRRSSADATEPMVGEFEQEIPADMPTNVAVFWFVTGLLVLLASSRLLIWGAVSVAHAFHVPDLVIGLTIVAFGTSLPELAASVVAARKREHDIAVGNVVGSNMFNILGVLGLPGAIAPGNVPPEVLRRDFPVMIAVTVFLLVLAREKNGARVLGRASGALLVLTYVGYLVLVNIRSF